MNQDIKDHILNINGNNVTIEAPADATRDQLMRFYAATKPSPSSDNENIPVVDVVGTSTTGVKAPAAPVYDPEQHSALRNVYEGVTAKAGDYLLGTKQLFNPNDPALAKEQQMREAQNAKLYDSTSGAIGKGITEFGLPLAGVAGAALAGVPLAAGAVGAAAGGAALGGLEMGSSNDKMVDALFGAVGGGAGYGLMKGAGNLVGGAIPKEMRKNVAILLKNKVYPTVGQLLGGGYNKVEEALASRPILGSFIESARGKAGKEELTRAWMNRVLEPLGKSSQDIPVTREGMETVQNIVSDEFEKYAGKTPVSLDMDFKRDMGDLYKKLAPSGMPESSRVEFAKLVKDMVYDPVNNAGGTLSGKSFKEVNTNLGNKINELIRSNDSAQANKLIQVKNALYDASVRQNPEVAQKLIDSGVNQAYVNNKILVDALSKSGTQRGATPSQFEAAVRGNNPSKNRYAKGKAHGQDISDAAIDVLQKKLPNSGTADRAATIELMANPGAVAEQFNQHPIYTTLGVVPMLAYTDTGRKLMANILARDRGKVLTGAGDALKTLAPVGGVLGGRYGVDNADYWEK